MARSAYQWDAADYARNSVAQYQWAQELIDKLSLRGDETVLDIGCGDGKVTALIAARVPAGSVVGVDRSWEMVAHARAAFPAIPFLQMDAARLGFGSTRPSAGFDAAFSNAALHWVLDQPAVLRGVAQALKPGGRLLFQMGGAGNAAEIVRVLEALMRQPRWRLYFEHNPGQPIFRFPYAFHTPEDYIALLADAGLRAIRAELLPKDMRHNGREGLVAWIRTAWLPYTERIPEAERAAFIDAVADTYLAAHPIDDAGLAHVGMVRLEVEAVK